MFMIHILHLIREYGYIGLFLSLAFGIIGLPVPDETLLTFSGFLIYRGELRYLLTLLTAFAGSICGMSLSYFVGRKVGYPLIHKYGKYVGMTPKRLTATKKWFEKYGKFTVSFGYFVPGIRQVSAYLAGISKWSFSTFALYAFPGGFIWATVFITTGYFLGEKWHLVEKLVISKSRILVLLLLLLIGFWLIYKRRKNKSVG